MKACRQDGDDVQWVCPKTDSSRRATRRRRWAMWLFPLVGLVSLIWFLIRVLPKPSRASYPCQRLAMPLASGFVLWLLGLGGVFTAYHRATRYLREARYLLAAACLILGLAAGWVTLTYTPEDRAGAAFVPSDPPNSPMGVAKGIFSGRVVWVHDPDATDWDGSTGYWWEDTHTDQARVDEMLSKAVRRLTGTATDGGAWDALFRHYNLEHGRGDVGYQTGERIAIKINLNTCGGTNPDYSKRGNENLVDTSPQMVRGLLRQLVNHAGVPQAMISVGDPFKSYVNLYWDRTYPEFPGVTYLDQSGGNGRTQATGTATRMVKWSKDDPNSYYQDDRIPLSYFEADYMINLAALKAHQYAGVTGSAKNHYGSFLRWPGGSSNYCNLHTSLALFTPGAGRYRALVDITGHEHLGGKTVLYLVDGLWGGPSSGARPIKWQSAPFDNDWPSSVFVSQDPVAIDSVELDFVRTEWNIIDYADDYLHESALADDPPSGTFYDPEGDGTRLVSLGVHEHWNNAIDKQYSRNLGSGTGIELVAGGEPASITGWHSAVEHDRGVGEALLEIGDDGSFSEPRSAGINTLIVTFSAPIDPGSLTPEGLQIDGLDANYQPVDLSGIAISTGTRDGDTTGVITFTGLLPDYAVYTVQIIGVMDAAGNGLAGDDDRIMTALAGDVSGDLRVNATDLSRVRAARASPIDPQQPDQVRADVSCDGRVNAADLSRVRARRGNDARDIVALVAAP